MTFHVLTIFPEFFRGPFEHGVVGKAREAGLLKIGDPQSARLDVRPAPDGGRPAVRRRRRHGAEAGADVPGRRVDLGAAGPEPAKVVLLSAQGPLFDQRTARRLSELDEVLLICGRYEGVDERVAEHLADEEISIGNYVLSGGELAAAVVVDAVARLIPGVLGNEESSRNESFASDVARLSALHAAGRVSRLEGAGGAARRQSRGDRAVAPRGGAGEDAPAAAGPDEIDRERIRWQ